MKLFSVLDARAMRWFRHRYAPSYLGAVSFAESSFFPIPPDVMPAPTSLANPSKARRFTLVTTLASVAGALSMALLPFTLASLIGRGARMEAALHRTIDRLGWATVAVVVVGAIVYQWAGTS